MKLKALLLVASAAITTWSCQNNATNSVEPQKATPKGKVEVYITPVVGTAPFKANEAFTTPAGEQLTIRDFRFFVSDVGMAKLNSMEVEATPVAGDSSQAGIWLVNFGRPNAVGSVAGVNNAFKFSFMADTGSYADLRLSVAVPRTYNSANIVENPFPVNANTGMYWTWNSGFKFLVINGSTPVSPVPVHLSIGQNSRVMIYSFRAMMLAASRSRIVVTEDGVTKIYLNYDLNALFTNTDGTAYSFVQKPGLPTPLQVHGGYWSDILKANASNAFELSSFETIKTR